MKASKSVFFCSQCGYETSRWQGQCPSCRAWNTLVEAPAAQKAVEKALCAGPCRRNS